MKREDTTQEWVDIPNYGGKYQISNDKVIRAVYHWCGSKQQAHFKLLKAYKGSIQLYRDGIGKKYCIDYLYETCFGVEHVDNLEGEVWMAINGYKGLYKVSNKGRILSERKYITKANGVVQFAKEQIIQCHYKINSGYYCVNLIKDGVSKHWLVHRLVASNFLPNPFNYEEVNHKDENKTNNCIDNLEWCDKIYNSKFGTAQERRIATRLRNNNGQYGYKRKANR